MARRRIARAWEVPAWRPWTAILAILALSLALVAARPSWAPGVALVEGLLLGTALGAWGLVPSYDSAWDEFWESTALALLLGAAAVLACWARRERPSAFFLLECAAGTASWILLLFVPPIAWLGADLLLFAGVFTGWFFSSLFRSDPP